MWGERELNSVYCWGVSDLETDVSGKVWRDRRELVGENGETRGAVRDLEPHRELMQRGCEREECER